MAHLVDLPSLLLHFQCLKNCLIYFVLCFNRFRWENKSSLCYSILAGCAKCSVLFCFQNSVLKLGSLQFWRTLRCVMGLAGRRVSLYDRMCISAPTAVNLSSLIAHLSVCLSASLNAFYQSLGSCLWLSPWDRVLPSVCSGEIPGCSYGHPAKFLDVPCQSSSD